MGHGQAAAGGLGAQDCPDRAGSLDQTGCADASSLSMQRLLARLPTTVANIRGLSLEPRTRAQLKEAAAERRRADRKAEARRAAEARLAAIEAKLGRGGQYPPLGTLTQRTAGRGPNGRTTPSRGDARVCEFRNGPPGHPVACGTIAEICQTNGWNSMTLVLDAQW